MRTFAAALLAVLVVASGSGAAPNPASGGFARAANSPAGRAAFELAVATTPAGEAWTLEGQDVVPFYFEQGVASFGGSDLVFSSRNSLSRTAVGCDDALDPYRECYDVREENPTPIPSSLVGMGFNHVGGIDVGPPVPGAAGAGVVFAPLETDPPRTRRAYAAYDLQTLARVGLSLEEVEHRYNSWVAVDPSARFMITAQDTMNPIRVYEVGFVGADLGFDRREDLDVTAVSAPSPLPNFQGCKFDGPTTLYCSNWAKRDSYFDVRTEVYRIDLSAPIGTPGIVATGRLAFSVKAQPRYLGGVPYGLETEDLAFWGGKLHVTLRGEALGWIHVLHFARA